MAARDSDRIRPDMPVSGDVVREREHPQSEARMTGTERMRDTARSAAGSAERTARSALSAQKERAATGLHDIVEVLHATGNQLRDHDRGSVADYADRIADRVDEFARNLQDRDVGELIADAEDYARQHPEIVLGGALVLGLVMARFLKSSSYRPEREGEMAYGRARVYPERRMPSEQPMPEMPEEPLPYQSRGTGI